MSQRHRAYACAGVLAGLVLTAGGFADPVDATNNVDWRFDTDDLAAMVGEYWLEAFAYAKCGHPPADLQNPPAKHGFWAVGAPGGLAKVDITANANLPPDAFAFAYASVAASVPGPYGGSNQYKFTVTHEVKGDKWAGYCDVGTSYARRWSKSVADIDGATVTGSHLQATSGSVQLTYHKHGSAGSIYHIHEDYVRDPVTLTIREVETDSEWEETIWDVEVENGGELAAVDWVFSSTEGVRLEVGRNDDDQIGSYVHISGRADSDWLLNPYGEFTATLDASGFSATGAWAGLPWQFDFDGGDIIRATLDASYLPTELEYEVPDDLINPDFHYDQGINVLDYQEGSAVIPAPGSLGMLAIGLAFAARRR
jgi:hypothetical protein